MPRSAYIILLAFLILSIGIRLWLNKPQSLPRNVDLKFEATVKSEPKIYETGQVISIADAKIYTGLYPKYRVGDRILVSGKINDSGKMFSAKVEKVGEAGGFGLLRTRLRDKISRNIGAMLPAREATLVVGSVLGVDNIGQQFRDELTKTGTIHVVVVSGQNLMIVSGILMALAPYIGRRKSLVLATFAVVAYAFLAGFEPPVLRAAVMVFAVTLAMFFGREVNVLWTLGMAAFIIVFLFPQSLFEVSFQLTFAATLGILTLGKWLDGVLSALLRGNPVSLPLISLSHSLGRDQRSVLNLHDVHRSQNSEITPSRAPSRHSWLKESLVQNAAIATSAYLFTAPVIIFYFGRISPLAPLANLLVAEAVFPIMVLGFVTAAASLVFIPVAQLFAYFAFVPAFYFSQVVRCFAALPFGQYSFGQGNWILVISAYIVLLTFLWMVKTKRF